MQNVEQRIKSVHPYGMGLSRVSQAGLLELSGMVALILLRRAFLPDGEITVIIHLSLPFMT